MSPTKQKPTFKKSVKEIDSKKMPTKSQMLEDVFMMARQHAIANHPKDKMMLASLLNFEMDMLQFLKEKDVK